MKNNVVKIYAIGSSANKIAEYFTAKVDVEKYKTLEATVNTAFAESEKGDVILLSPACASFDMFKNYEERGTKFKEIVAKL